MVGSGPYALADYQIAEGYTLKASPNYGANPFCTWTGCQPQPHTYAGTVEVTWETSAEPGEQSYIAGTADLASIPSTDFSLFIQLIDLGKIIAVSAPTISIAFAPFDMNFDVGTAQRFTTTTINVHSDFFSYLGMREFFTRAYPYSTIENTINTKDGIQLSFNYGGAIPQFMANYYPTNIPWPNTDPCTNVANTSCPVYWWDQMQSPTSPYYDPEVASCTSANPCQMPMFGETGNPTGDEINALWTSELSTLTNGALKVSVVDVNFVTLVQTAQSSPPGQNPFTMYGLGWAPDYPDPTDYVVPLYSANSTYTYGDAVEQSLYTPQFTTGCAQPYENYSYWANATIAQACQGVAYKSMLRAMQVAAVTPAGPLRVLLYNEVEKIAYSLALYTLHRAEQLRGRDCVVAEPGVGQHERHGGHGGQPVLRALGERLPSLGAPERAATDGIPDGRRAETLNRRPPSRARCRPTRTSRTRRFPRPSFRSADRNGRSWGRSGPPAPSPSRRRRSRPGPTSRSRRSAGRCSDCARKVSRTSRRSTARSSR